MLKPTQDRLFRYLYKLIGYAQGHYDPGDGECKKTVLGMIGDYKRTEIVKVQEHALIFHGHVNDAKRWAEYFRDLAEKAGVDLDTTLNDLVFGLEVAYQSFYGLDEDDFGRVK